MVRGWSRGLHGCNREDAAIVKTDEFGIVNMVAPLLGGHNRRVFIVKQPGASPNHMFIIRRGRATPWTCRRALTTSGPSRRGPICPHKENIQQARPPGINFSPPPENPERGWVWPRLQPPLRPASFAASFTLGWLNSSVRSYFAARPWRGSLSWVSYFLRA